MSFLLIVSSFLVLVSQTWAILTTSSTSLCDIPMDGSCKCLESIKEDEILASPRNNDLKNGLVVDCYNMTGSGLHHDVDSIVKHFNGSRSISELNVRDSNLAHMRGLPSGLVHLKHLTLDNTNIDLEQIRESSEILESLITFKIYRENFTEIPEDFFKEFHRLNNFGLNNVGLKGISSDGLEFLEDSLKELSLRENKLRSIPVAVVQLPYLETLDLTDNDITYIPDDTGFSMEAGLRSLSTLTLNTINCTCRFGTGDFADWIRSHAISGVTCKYPAVLRGRDVSTTPTEDFCSSHSNRGAHMLTSCLSVVLSSHVVAVFFILLFHG